MNTQEFVLKCIIIIQVILIACIIFKRYIDSVNRGNNNAYASNIIETYVNNEYSKLNEQITDYEDIKDENIILVDLVGGIGNQLYFLTLGLLVQKINNYNHKIYLVNKDIAYGRPMYFDTLFNKFNVLKINDEDINNDNFIFIQNNEINNNYIGKSICIKMEKSGYYQETARLLPIINDIKDNINFPLKTQNKIAQIINKYNISDDDYLVHIRLPDHVTGETWHGLFKEHEYKYVKDYISKLELKRLFIITNDQERSNKLFNINNIDLIYLEDTSDIDDLYYITKFNNIITSPSTYCVWGCLLGFNQKKNYIVLWDNNIWDNNDNNDNTDNNYQHFINYRNDMYDNQYLPLLTYNASKIDSKTYEINNDKLKKGNTNNILISCFYVINNKYGGMKKYLEWFYNTLINNETMFFYVDNKSIQYIKRYRNNNNTNYMIYDIKDFKSAKYDYEINNTHVPSKELAMIWNEKINMIKMVKDNINVEWYIWYDAGLASLRNNNYLINKELKLEQLKKYENYNKSIFYYQSEMNSLSDDWLYLHNICGGSFIVNNNYIDNVYNKYYEYLEKCFTLAKEKYICGSEQIILSRLKYDNQLNFIKLGSGYNSILLNLL
jgi:hypothetical protein